MKNLMFLNKLFQSNIDKGIIKFASRFSLFSLILGTFALTISLSLLEGFDETIHSLAYKFDSRYHISTYNNSNFQLNDKIIKIINNNDETAIIYPIIERYTILKSSNGLKPIYIKAVTNNYVKNKFNINFQSNNSIIISDYLKKELLNKNPGNPGFFLSWCSFLFLINSHSSRTTHCRNTSSTHAVNIKCKGEHEIAF